MLRAAKLVLVAVVALTAVVVFAVVVVFGCIVVGSVVVGGSGALTILATPSFKESFHADFALLFEGAQVAGRVRFGPRGE